MKRLLFATLLALSPLCRAGSNVWTGQGPQASSVDRVSVSPADPSKVFACGPAGYRGSTDGGTTWTPLSDAGVPDYARDCFELVAAVNALYRCSGDSGCFRSTDGGVSWISLGVQVGGAPSIAVDPTGGVILVADYYGVHRSGDGGLTWGLVLGGNEQAPTGRAVAFDPASPATAFAGGHSYHYFRSDDGGVHWNQGTATSSEPHIFDFAFNAASSSVWSGTGFGYYYFESGDVNSIQGPLT